MQKAVTLMVDNMTLRGMEHVPEGAEQNPVPAVILFHGYTGTKLEPHRMFLKISRALEKAGIAAFRFDFLGSGESDGDFEDMTASGEIREAKAILEMVKQDPRIQSDKITLLGLSMGGFVASITAGDLPQEVHRLILLAPAGNMPDIVQFVAQEAQKRGELTAESKYFDDHGNLVGRGLLEDVVSFNAFERSKPYQGEVLLIHGTNDEAVPYQVSQKYVEDVYGERAILRLIDGADHTFNNAGWESEVIHHIMEFLTAK